MPPRARPELFEEAANDVRYGQVVAVRRLTRLEEDVWVLGRAAQHRPVGVERTGTVRRYQLLRNELPQDFLRQGLDARDFVASAEAVLHVQERYARAQGSGLGYEREVLRLLHRAREKHGPAGRARGHDV